MKKELGEFLFIGSLWILIRYTGVETSGWIIALLFLLVWQGVELSISGIIDKKLEEVKEEQWLKNVLNRNK